MTHQVVFFLGFGRRVDDAQREFFCLRQLDLDPVGVVGDALFELRKTSSFETFLDMPTVSGTLRAFR